MTRKPRVSVISLKWDGVSYYRGFMPFEELDDQGLIEFVDNRKLLESDVVVLERIFLPAHFALIAELKQRGKRLIYQIDDDPFNVPPYHPSYQVYQQREVKEGLFHTLRSVDRIIAATAPLKSILQQRLGGKVPISVIGNYLDFKSAWNPNRFASTLPLYRRPDKIVIGWSGALGHQADLQLLQGVFEELVRVYQDRLLFRFLGHHPEFVAAEALPGQVEMYSWVDVHSYPETLYSLALDIGLIPLVDNAHNRSKTLLKFLEYSALPIPSVISRVGPYQAVPADCGLLVENKFGKWVQAIKRLIDGAPEREALRRRAHEHVKASFDIADHTAPWLEAILSVKPDLSKAAFTVPCHSSADVLPDSVDIIVPIHDAFAETRSCLESVLAHTDLTRHRLLLVNDGSTDSRMAPFLEQLVENVSGRNIVLVQHTEAQGFIKSCNEAMRLGRQDVVLLNSDTMVSARWLDKLRECAYANPSVGTVTPLSNNATIMTIPITIGGNSRDTAAAAKLAQELQAVNAHLESQAGAYIELPVGVGFCFYIKREVLDKYGLFDEVFGQGYGEENDLCMRMRSEYASVADTRTFVYHCGEASFSKAAVALKDENSARLNQRYPLYNDMVGMWCASDPLLSLRLQVMKSRSPKPRVLQVLHNFLGYAGTELFTAKMSQAFEDRYDTFLVYPQQGALVLNNLHGLLHCAPIPETRTRLYMEHDKRIERAFQAYLEKLQPEIVHFQHLALLPMSLPFVAKRFGAQVVFTLHDSFPLCPDPFLTDRPSIDHCLDVKKCTESGCFTRKFALANSVAHRRREVVGETLQRDCDCVVVPSKYMQRMVQTVFGLEARLIPHGIDLPLMAHRPSPKRRLAYLGNAARYKGAQLLLDTFARVQSRLPNTELHLYGNFLTQELERIPSSPDIYIHGPYTQDDLAHILGEIDLGVIPSLAPEAFCYTLSELSAAGIPALVSRVGALPERVLPEMVFDPTIKDLEARLLHVAENAELQAEAAAYARTQVRPFAEEVAAYAEIYKECLRAQDHPEALRRQPATV